MNQRPYLPLSEAYIIYHNSPSPIKHGFEKGHNKRKQSIPPHTLLSHSTPQTHTLLSLL